MDKELFKINIMEKLNYLFNENDFNGVNNIKKPFKIYISMSGFFIVSEFGKIQLAPTNEEILEIIDFLNLNKL